MAMDPLLIIAGCIFIVVALLWFERAMMHRIRMAIPVRIAVIGTRGKTSVTRLIAAGLREGGLQVLAKTTGSEPRIVLPNGEEQAVRRRGMTTPLEQRRILYQARKLQCDAVVIEGMSIRPESLRAELGQLIRPHVVVITNTYDDHLSDMGDPAAVFADAVPSGATVLLQDGYPSDELQRMDRRGVTVRTIDADNARHHMASLPTVEWPQNLALALAGCAQAGVATDTSVKGMALARMDVGQFGAWRVRVRATARAPEWIAVNGFATNDPQSAMAALDQARSRWPMDHDNVVGVLNLRHDRADRTLQWMEALGEYKDTFDQLIACGAVPMSVQRRLKRQFGDRMAIVRSTDPRRVMDEAAKLSPQGGCLFGFGNIGGAGLGLLKRWQEVGEKA
jgi:gamma-polyglutamate synthase